MMTEGPGFAVIAEDGVVFHVARTYDDALRVATRTMPHADVWYEGPPPWEDEEVSPSRFALAANALHQIGSKRKRTEPERSLDLIGLKPMTSEQILGMSLEEAFGKIKKFFPTKRPNKEGVIRKIETYGTAKSMVEHLFGTNYKLAKATSDGVEKAEATGLNLLPARSWRSEEAQEIVRAAPTEFGVKAVLLPPDAVNVCASATAQCSRSCLVFSGQNFNDRYNTIKKLALTMSFFNEPLAFMRVLYEAIGLWQDKCECKESIPFLRLNVYSDVPWELLVPDMFDHFSGIRFYDYTKVTGRMNMVNGEYPIENYDLTFSYSGSGPNLAALEHEIGKNKRRVAVAFANIGTSRSIAVGSYIPTEPPKPGKKGTEGSWPLVPQVGLPSKFMGLTVIDGDRNDFRPLDPHPCIVGLRWKIPKKQQTTAAKARVFIVPGYMVNEQGDEDDRGSSFVIMDLPRYKDVFGRNETPPWSGYDFREEVTIEEAD